MLLDREHSMTLHACDVFVFFFASSTKTSPFILHTESVRICTCTCMNVRRRILNTLVFVSVFRAYAHTHTATDALLLATFSIPTLRSFILLLLARSFLLPHLAHHAVTHCLSVSCCFFFHSQCVFVFHYLVHIVRDSLFE